LVRYGCVNMLELKKARRLSTQIFETQIVGLTWREEVCDLIYDRKLMSLFMRQSSIIGFQFNNCDRSNRIESQNLDPQLSPDFVETHHWVECTPFENPWTSVASPPCPGPPSGISSGSSTPSTSRKHSKLTLSTPTASVHHSTRYSSTCSGRRLSVR
jgi:hypothetical protein